MAITTTVDGSWAEIKSDLKKYLGAYLSGTAGKIRDELTQEAHDAIELFYASYTPVSYRRHYYNFRTKSFEKYYSNAHGTVFRGGVTLTPDKMDDIYQDPTLEVFDSVYAGFHGVAAMFVSPKSFFVTPHMDPSPIEMIYAKQRYISRHIEEYTKAGLAKAKKQKYSVIEVR